MLGNQYVVTIYSGSATYDAGAGARKVTFICLHAGEKGRGFRLHATSLNVSARKRRLS